MVDDQLSAMVHFNENYLFIICKSINIYIKHNHKHKKQNVRQAFQCEQLDTLLQNAVVQNYARNIQYK